MYTIIELRSGRKRQSRERGNGSLRRKPPNQRTTLPVCYYMCGLLIYDARRMSTVFCHVQVTLVFAYGCLFDMRRTTPLYPLPSTMLHAYVVPYLFQLLMLTSVCPSTPEKLLSTRLSCLPTCTSHNKLSISANVRPSHPLVSCVVASPAMRYVLFVTLLYVLRHPTHAI